VGGGGMEQVLLIFARLPSDKYPYRIGGNPEIVNKTIVCKIRGK
jgi:hypothetical protein